MRKLVSFLLLLIPLITFSNSVSISGNALFFKNELIQAFRYDNLLSEHKQLLAKTLIRDDGSYTLTFEIEKAEVIVLKIEMRELELHLHPNTKISLNFSPFKNASNQRIPFRYNIQYQQIPNGIAPDSIYQNVKRDFAKIQNDLSTETKLIDHYNSFFNQSDSLYLPYLTTDSLFAGFYNYFKANALLQTEYSKSKLIAKYLLQNQIEYSNREYLKFFKASFNPRIHRIISKNTKEFERVIKEYQVYNSLVEFLQIDSILGPAEFRSLALLIYTNSKSSKQYINPKLKGGIINQASNFCLFNEQKVAALNFQSKNSLLKKNIEAPIFELQNSSGIYVSLQKFRGKPVYLGFIHSKSTTCQRDLQIIEKLRKKYRKATFLLVISDRDSVLMSQIPKETSNLKFLYLNKEYAVLEKYQIWSYPIYYLIDKHGYFMQAPANRPNDMFDTFAKMFAPKSSRKRYEIIKP